MRNEYIFNLGPFYHVPVGKGLLIMVNGRELAVFRNEYDEIFIMENYVSSGEGSLHQGSVEGTVFTAPASRFRFDLMDGEGLDNRHFLTLLPSWVEEGIVFMRYPTLVFSSRNIQSVLN